MRRTNTFNIEWDNPEEIRNLALGCSTFWNKLNYKRRKTFLEGDIDYSSEKLYNDFKGWLGSATVQQIVRKNNEAWNSFFSLLEKYNNSDGDMDKPSPPGYWKDRDKDRKVLRILVRNDCYEIKGRKVKLPFGRTGKIVGKPHWDGKQGRLEIKYDPIDGCWRAQQPVEVEPRHQPSGQKTAYVDLGIIYPLTAKIEGVEKPTAYNGKPLLSEWWETTKEIEKYQSRLKEKNNRHSSKRLKRLYRKRKRRFRDAIRKMMHNFVERCRKYGVNKIVAGDLNGIRENTRYNKKADSMIHNLWSHKYLLNRMKWTAENYGIEVELIDERGTSSRCPRCGSEKKTRRGRLFKCKNCGLEAHRDVVGCLNIGFVWQGRTNEPTVKGSINRMMAHPKVAS